MRTLHDFPWPAPVVLGSIETGDLVFLPEEYAQVVAADLDRWRAADTWGQARVVAREVEIVAAPFNVDELEESQDGDAPFVIHDQFGVADGDWPPAAQQVALALVERHFPDHAAFGVGSVVDTVFNGPVLMVGADEEAALTESLEMVGCSVRRDDELIRRTDQA